MFIQKVHNTLQNLIHLYKATGTLQSVLLCCPSSLDNSFSKVFSLEESKESIKHVVNSFGDSFPDLQFTL